MRILTLSQLSLAGSSGIAEAKIPLWWADGTMTSAYTGTSSGGAGLKDGSSSAVASPILTLATLSSTWPSSLQFAFESTLLSANSSATVYMALWDTTSNTLVSSSQVSTTSTTATVVRSGKFILTPSHSLGVTLWTNNASYGAQAADASLIIFP